MVVLVTTPQGRGHMDGFVNTYDRSYGRDLQEILYSDLLERGAAPRAVYLMGDVWKMNSLQRAFSESIADRLIEGGNRVLNHPSKVLRRYEFLRAQWKAGANDFNVFLMDERDQAIRFPVFVRMASDHRGPLSDLIEDRDSLERILAEVVLNGADPREVMIVEFKDTSVAGVFRKYGALRIGEAIIPHHVMRSDHWDVKSATRDRTEGARDEADAYVREDPHRDLLMPIFESAAIEYGRIDYSMDGGRVQTWEINDNPVFMHLGKTPLVRLPRHLPIKAAFDRLTSDLAPGPPTPIDTSALDFWEAFES